MHFPWFGIEELNELDTLSIHESILLDWNTSRTEQSQSESLIEMTTVACQSEGSAWILTDCLGQKRPSLHSDRQETVAGNPVSGASTPQTGSCLPHIRNTLLSLTRAAPSTDTLSR